MLCVPAHMKAHTTASGKKKPFTSPVLMAAIFTFGATPTMPKPTFAAAIVPAVWVPWPLSSFQADGLVLAVPPMHEALLLKSTFGARLGCVKSRPVSISPTVTEGLPLLIAWAAGAWIWSMSHWLEVSALVIGVVLALSTTLSSLRRVANGGVAETPSILESLIRLSRNVVLSELATATPMSP